MKKFFPIMVILTMLILAYPTSAEIQIFLITPANYTNASAYTDVTFNLTDANMTDNMTAILVFANSTNHYVVDSNTNVSNYTTTTMTVNTSLDDGLYDWYINATDNQSTTNQSEIRVINIDETNPDVYDPQIDDTTPTIYDTVRINVTANDTALVVESVLVNGQVMTSIGSDVYDINTTPETLGCLDGRSCTLTFVANDTVNNINNTVTLSITTDIWYSASFTSVINLVPIGIALGVIVILLLHMMNMITLDLKSLLTLFIIAFISVVFIGVIQGAI